MADRAKKIKFLLKNIKNQRESLGYSQEYVALKMNMSQNAYSKIETGKSAITVERLYDIASVLLTTPEKLMQTTMKLSNSD
ncbi:helix-turn-helix transcriptional regulator [Mucilaginibacter corticis]|uniref:Helix-turn-helix transcriptional regulator n=1 Tax=Mucilaginibacter corticis TaxID=2597670 RepID=A0A556M955_9SPHI|nr:helix-turn-helix transcriptional regulator [Mucilaginibacter corticis]TSJ36430.1 helix-turn-helix transcriptional regulator [Mucilaginibacter corticis]